MNLLKMQYEAIKEALEENGEDSNKTHLLAIYQLCLFHYGNCDKETVEKMKDKILH